MADDILMYIPHEGTLGVYKRSLLASQLLCCISFDQDACQRTLASPVTVRPDCHAMFPASAFYTEQLEILHVHDFPLWTAEHLQHELYCFDD